MADQKAPLPGGNVVIDDCDDDGLYHGRYRPPGDPTGDWKPVTEEAESDNQIYGRQNRGWVPITNTGGKSVTEVVPAVATVGLSAALPAILYGTGFVTGDVVLWDGVAQPTVVTSPNELSFSIDTNLGVAPSSVTVTVAGATGAAGFVFLPTSSIDIAFGIGLNYDETLTPPVVDLQPPNIIEWADPTKIGGINVPPRTATQGLAIEGNGLTQAPLATDLLAGTHTEPPQDGKNYARVYDTTAGAWTWVEATGSIFVQDDPPTQPVPPNSLWWDSNAGKLYLWYDDGSTVQWVQVDGGGEPPEPYYFALGLSFDETTRDVNLTPAGWDSTFLGGVYGSPRTATQGLDLAAAGTGEISVPLATPDLAGSIVEPPADAKGYVRTTQLNGVSQWVPPAPTEIDFGTGLTKDETATPPIVHLQPALDYAIGGIMEPTQDGMAYSRQFDIANQVWIWTPALTAGLQITGLIPDQVVFGPGEPLVTVHAYGMEFTTTSVLMLDGADMVTSFVSETELTFVLNPAVPINEQSHIVTVKDPAYTPPEGLGAEEFKFIVPSIQVDYGKGLSFDTSTTPPIVHLDPAGPTNLGGVFVPLRSATQGLAIDMGDGTGADPATGELTAPLATPDLAGSIVEPPADSEKYVRTTNEFTGVSSWEKSGAHMDYEIGLHEWFDPNTGERLNRVDLKPATVIEIGGMLEVPQLPDNAQWARVWGGWEQVITATPVDYGVGLSLNPGADPGDPEIVHLQPAGNEEKYLGGVFVTPVRGRAQGLTLGPDGMLQLLHATNEHLGGILEPEVAGVLHGRIRDEVTGINSWEELPPAGIQDAPPDFVYGRTAQRWIQLNDDGTFPAGSILYVQVRGDTMQGPLYLHAEGVLAMEAVTVSQLNRMEVDVGIGLTKIGPRIDLQPATAMEIGGLMEVPQLPDGGKWVRTFRGWETLPPSSSTLEFRYGLQQTGDIVDITPATGGDQAGAPELGGVYGTTRSDRNGIVIDGYGHISAPLATADLAGTIIEPVADGKGYVRASQPDGSYQWVPPAPSGGSVTIADDPPANPNHGDLWWESDSGTMFIWYDDGTSAQWVQTDSSAMPTFGIGLEQTGSVVDLQPANTGGEIGGVIVVNRSPLSGLEYDLTTGTLWNPPATNILAGSIVDAPNDGQQYARYYDNTAVPPVWKWQAVSTGGVFVGDAPPPLPLPNQLWFDSDSGCTYIWYVDADSAQWVMQSSPVSPAPPAAGGLADAPIDGTEYLRKDGAWVNPTAAAGAFLPLDGSVAMTANLRIAKAGWKGVQLCQADATTIDWAINGDEQTFRISAVAGGGADMFGLAADGSGAFFFCPLSVEGVPVVTEAPADGSQYTRQDNQWVANTVTVQATGGHGDVKMGFQGTDHAGWVRLDGRAITALTPTQQDVATNILGFTTNIPNATDVVAMQPGVARAMGSVAGSWNIAQANLPDVDLTATSAGAHTHVTDSQGAHQHIDNSSTHELMIDTASNVWVIDDGNEQTLGAHTHTALSAGAHTHPVPLGGSGTPITPKNMAVNMFVFLGD